MPEVVVVELARHAWQPGQRSAAYTDLEPARKDRGNIAGVVVTDEHRFVPQHLARFLTVERDPLQLGVQGGPCRPVADAGDGRFRPRGNRGRAGCAEH